MLSRFRFGNNPRSSRQWMCICVAIAELPWPWRSRTQSWRRSRSRWRVDDITFPYIPGLLSFREAPLCLSALRSLQCQPDLILADGQGRAHPRRFGIACHIGVELEIPTIGVAKSILTGRFESLGSERGATAPLVTRGEVVGMAVRTRTGVSPVYVSVGNLITLEEAVAWTLNAVQKVRLPEPSRRAHRAAQQLARELK